MARKVERAVNSGGVGEKEGKSQQNRVEVNLDAIIGAVGHITPLLVDSNQGARILGVSLSHFYKFMRKNNCTPPIPIGTLQMWRRKDLLRFTGKRDVSTQFPEDIVIDVQMVAALCSISKSMVYKMNEMRALPEPLMYGRSIRWSYQAIEEWIENGCPPRRPHSRKKPRK